MEIVKAPAPRTSLNIVVEFRRNYAREASSGQLRNISISGAFLQHKAEALMAGDKLMLNFLVSGRERAVQALVVWSNKAGSGVKFLPQNKRDTQIIDDLIYFVEAKKADTKSILDNIFKKVA